MTPPDVSAFRRLRLATFALLSGAFVLAFFHRVAPTVLSSHLASTLDASAVALGSIAAMYFHVYALMQIPAGVIADRLGARATVGVSAAVGGVGSVVFALAPDVFWASVGRFIIGFGVSFAFVGTLRAAGSWYRPEQYAQVSGWIILIGNLGAILASSPLSFALTYFDWRTIFLAVGVLSVALAVAIAVFVRNTPGEHGFHDMNQQAPAHDETPLGQALKSCLRRREIWFCFAAGFALVGPFFGFAGIWALPLLVQKAGLSETEAADCLALSLILLAFSPAFIGWYSDHVGRRRWIVLACMGISTLMWFIFWAWDGFGFWSACLLLTIGGICCSGMVLIYACAKDLAPPSVAGFAVALVNTGLFTGAAILQMVIGWLLELGGYVPDGTVPPDFGPPLLLMVVVSALGLALAARIPETHPSRLSDEEEARLDPI